VKRLMKEVIAKATAIMTSLPAFIDKLNFTRSSKKLMIDDHFFTFIALKTPISRSKHQPFYLLLKIPTTSFVAQNTTILFVTQNMHYFVNKNTC